MIQHGLSYWQERRTSTCGRSWCIACDGALENWFISFALFDHCSTQQWSLHFLIIAQHTNDRMNRSLCSCCLYWFWSKRSMPHASFPSPRVKKNWVIHRHGDRKCHRAVGWWKCLACFYSSGWVSSASDKAWHGRAKSNTYRCKKQGKKQGEVQSSEGKGCYKEEGKSKKKATATPSTSCKPEAEEEAEDHDMGDATQNFEPTEETKSPETEAKGKSKGKKSMKRPAASAASCLSPAMKKPAAPWTAGKSLYKRDGVWSIKLNRLNKEIMRAGVSRCCLSWVVSLSPTWHVNNNSTPHWTKLIQ